MASKHPPTNKQSFNQSSSEQSPDFSYLGSVEEAAESRTVASRERLRHQLSDEVERFLEKGGQVQQVEQNVTSSPPLKPVNRYGDRPI